MTGRPGSVGQYDVTLMPGGFFFGGGDERIFTLLGSCVAITMWHPWHRAGGMCHYLLPHRTLHSTDPQLLERRVLDGRYGVDAVELFVREIRRRGTAPADYQVKVFGGGYQFAAHAPGTESGWAGGDVPGRNAEAGLRLLAANGFTVMTSHLGGSGPRHVVLELATGDVWVRHQTNDAQVRRELAS